MKIHVQNATKDYNECAIAKIKSHIIKKKKNCRPIIVYSDVPCRNIIIFFFG